MFGSKNAAWSGDGCSVRQRGLNYTVCQCNHLTSFAIVMNPEGAETVSDMYRMDQHNPYYYHYCIVN